MKRIILSIVIVLFFITPAQALYVYEYDYDNDVHNMTIHWEFTGETLLEYPFEPTERIILQTFTAAYVYHGGGELSLTEVIIDRSITYELSPLAIYIGIQIENSIEATGYEEALEGGYFLFLGNGQDYVGVHNMLFPPDTTATATLTITDSAAVPEPLTLMLLSSGLIGLAGIRRKFKI